MSNRTASGAIRLLSTMLAALLASIIGLGDTHADVDGVITFDAVSVVSTDPDHLSDSRGLGAAMRVLGSREPFNMTVGAFAAIGKPDANRRMRDIYDISLNIGLNPPAKKRRLAIPFVSVGLDFLNVSTRENDGSNAAGMTMGMNARGGVFGHLGKSWMYSASVTYIGAVVPGTGEGLDGVTLHVGIGKKLFD